MDTSAQDLPRRGTSIGNFLACKREEKELTLATLAQQSGVSASIISLIENGRALPVEADLKALAKALGFPEKEAIEYLNGKEFEYVRKRTKGSTHAAFGAFLALRREMKGLSREELAKKADIWPKERNGRITYSQEEMIRRFENAERTPSINQLIKLANALEFSLSDIQPYFP